MAVAAAVASESAEKRVVQTELRDIVDQIISPLTFHSVELLCQMSLHIVGEKRRTHAHSFSFFFGVFLWLQTLPEFEVGRQTGLTAADSPDCRHTPIFSGALFANVARI